MGHIYVIQNQISKSFYTITNTRQHRTIIAFTSPNNANVLIQAIKNTNKPFKMNVLKTNKESLIRRCKVNCLDIIVYDDANNMHKFQHTTEPTDDWMFNLENCLLYY